MFSDFLKENGREAEFEMLPVPDLTRLLREFYGSVRNKKGEMYGKSSYVNLRAAVHRHITSPPYNRPFNILRDVQFQSANQVFMGVLRKMRVEGKDVTKHKEAITEGDMKKLYESGVLNTDTPMGLLRKVYVEISLQFGRRGREGLRDFTKESFVFKLNDEGKEYVTLAYNELDKNHQILLPKDNEKSQMMFSHAGDPMCPVESLRKYLAKLNPNCPSFFQKPKLYVANDAQIWYENKPLGVHTIGQLMKTISQEAKLSCIYTNHSIRATTATVLARAGVESRNICAVTGHKNESSLKSYISAPSLIERNTMSNILHCYGKENNVLVETNNSHRLAVPLSNTSSNSMTAASYAAGALFAGATFNGPTTINVNLNSM